MKKYIGTIIMSCLLSTVATAQQTTKRTMPVLENHNTAFPVCQQEVGYSGFQSCPT